MPPLHLRLVAAWVLELGQQAAYLLHTRRLRLPAVEHDWPAQSVVPPKSVSSEERGPHRVQLHKLLYRSEISTAPLS